MDADLKKWQERIRNGQRYQFRVGRSDEWQRYKCYYRHEFAKGVLPVNLMFSILRSMVPQVYFRNPRVTITPRKPGLEAELNARIVQKLDNWLLEELSTKYEIKAMIEDAFFCGISTGFLGYDSEYGVSKKTSSPDGNFSLSQFKASDGTKIEYNNNVSPGMPWFLRARPDDVIYPWGASSPSNIEWVAMRVFRKVDDLQADKKYSNVKDIKGTVNMIRTQPEGGAVQDYSPLRGEAADDMWVEIWQVHDQKSGQILALTMDHDQLIRKDDDDLQIDGLPIETLSFNHDPDYIYSIPDARLIEPQLLELMEIRTQAMRHRRVDILKGIIKKGALKPEEIEKLTSPEVMAIIEAETDGPLRDTFTPISPNASAILQDLAMAGDVVRGDIREMVGFSRMAQGEFQGKTHISAAETKAVFQSLNIRLDERRDAVADLLSRIVRKFNQQIFSRWGADRVAQVVGPDGAKWWLKFNGPQIKDEYDMHVEPEEGPALDSQSKKQMALDVADAWAKLNQGAIAQGTPVPAEIQRLLFSQFESSGLDIDRLLAQNQAYSQASQSAIAAQGVGQSPQGAISPQTLAAIQGGGR